MVDSKRRPPTLGATRRATSVAILLVGGAALLSALAGTVAWSVSGDTDYFVAGLWYAALFAVPLGIAVYGIERALPSNLPTATLRRRRGTRQPPDDD